MGIFIFDESNNSVIFLVARATQAFTVISESFCHTFCVPPNQPFVPILEPIKINLDCTPVLSDYFMVGFDSSHYICNTPVDSIQTKISIKTF